MLCWTVHLKGPRRFLHAAVAVGHKVYSFGGHCYGENDTKKIDVHVFNTVSLCWTKLLPATGGRRELPLEVPMRMCHTAVLLEDTIYIWGGIVNTEIEEVDNGLTIYGDKCNVLYAFDVDTHRWFNPRVSGTVPEARCGHSACVLERNMYVFGGFNLLKGYTNDIYKLDTTTMVWSLINTQGCPAPASEWHSATVIGTKMYVFGGRGDDGHYNDIRAFNTQTNCWLSTPSAKLLPEGRRGQLLPEGRRGQSAFAYNGELYIFGGNNFNDLWKFNPETAWKSVVPKGAGPVYMSWMCCCMVGDRIVLFGGRQTPGDLYILDLSPSLKTLCKLAVIQYGLEQSGLPHDIRWELAAMTTANGNRKPPQKPEDHGREGLVPGGKEETERPRAHHH